MANFTSSADPFRQNFPGVSGLFFLLAFALLPSAAIAQSAKIRGNVFDAVTLKAIPFPVISVEGDSIEYFGDMEGAFSLPAGKAERQIRVRAYQYLYYDFRAKSGDSIQVPLYYAHPFTWQHISLQKEKSLIRNLLRKKQEADPAKEKHYRYRSYNKSLITTGNMPAFKIYLDNILQFFTKARMGQYSLDHHIFLMESATEKVCVSKLKQKETVLATQVSGISQPPPLSYVSGFDALSIFSPFLRIGAKKYVSPLAGRPLRRYAFSIIDTIKSEDGPILAIKFNPVSYRRKNLLQGILYVSVNSPGVRAFQVWPSWERESTFSLAQESAQLPSGRWFPKVIRTSYSGDGIGSLRVPVQAVSKTWISDFSSLESDSGQFDEVVFDFRHSNLQSGNNFPDKFRAAPLQVKDNNTYLYFREAGSLSGIDRFLNFGQKLYDGHFPAGKLDLVFQDAFRFNNYEGLRPGLGLETSNRFSTRYTLGAYGAYGLRDKEWKYGLNAGLRISEKQSIKLAWKEDLAEPGIFSFAFDRRQYSSEDLRKFQVSRFDAIKSFELFWHYRPIRNFNFQASFESGSRQFLYNYLFIPLKDITSIGFSELKMQFCWSPLERFARIENQLYSVSDPLPVFWLHYARGISGILPSSFSYNRLETKMQWNRKILGLGDFGIRIGAGIQDAGLPYPLLFSARGSFREFSLLSYNSFETMRYNEFCYNRFFQVFLTHRFGRMQISTLPFLPYFTLVHNMGWGQLDNPEYHKGIQVSDIRKGFFETGLFLNDLFVIPLSGLELGIGAGIFLRYGPYRMPSDFDNAVLKFSASLGI